MTDIEYGSAPDRLGVFELPDWHEFMHYMYLPIYIGGRVHIPERLGFADSLVQACIDAEDRRWNRWEYVYVTVRRGYATPGNPLNRPGWHADGFGTEDVNYVWTDRYPTLFAVQEFTGISSDDLVSLTQFEEQVDPSRIVTYQDGELLRLDQRVIHAAPEIPAPGGVRSFFKVSFSNEKYNLLGNSHNYGLDYAWPMFDRASVRNDPARAGKDSL